MIKSGKAVPSPSERIKKRAATMAVERLGPFEFRVTPGEEGKVVRIVRFHPDYWPPKRYKKVGDRSPDAQRQPDEVFVECYAEISEASCEANEHALHCSHYEAVITWLLNEINKGEDDVAE